MGVLARLYRVVLEYTALIPRIAGPGELDDVVKWLAVLHALQVQAQAAIDLVMRLASLLGYTPSTPVEAVESLLGEGLLSRSEAELLRKVIGFRNIVVHEYQRVSRELVARILAEKRYVELARLAKKLVEEVQRRGLDP